MFDEEKDKIEIVDLSEEEEEDLDPEEIKELEDIIEEVTEDSSEEKDSGDEHGTYTEAEPNEVDSEASPEEEEITETLLSEEEEEEEEEEGEGDEENEDDEDEEEEEISEEKSSTPSVTAADLTNPEEKNPSESEEDKPPHITGHVVPQEECWLLKRNKSGFTLPKEIRDHIHPQQNFALVVEGHELAFYMINEEDIPHLKLAKKKVKSKPKGKKGKRGKKKKEGPEPDFPRYFHFEIEEQDKVQDALESAFYKFAETPPAVGEAMNMVIYVLTTYVKNQRMNDSRLRQTVIFFLCHIIELFNQPQLIEFCQREIIEEIDSSYLYQISLNQLAYTSFIMEKRDKADEFITKCIEVINKYDKGEMYAIMDSFKHMIHTLTPIQGKLVPKEDLEHVKTSLEEYREKLEDIDYEVQYIEMLERMGFITEAYDAAKFFMDKLDMENPLRDQFKAIRRRIGKESD